MPEPPTRVLHDMLLASLAASPRRPACRTLPEGVALDADSFERRIVGAERRLARVGGDRGPAAFRPGGGLVLMSARNLDSCLVAIAALWKRGCIPILAAPGLSRSELARQVLAFRPSSCLLDRRADPPGGAGEDLGEALPGLRAWLPGRPAGRRTASHPSGATRAALPPDAAMVRVPTGREGAPRGVVVTADQLLADARNTCATAGIQPGDTVVAALPLSDPTLFTLAVMSLVVYGARPLLIERPRPRLLLEALSGPGPFVLPGTPRLFEVLLRAAGRRRLRGLRLCLTAGSPAREGMARAFRERLGQPLRTLYGFPECGGVCYDRSRDGALPDGCVGEPLEGVQITLRPEAGAPAGSGRVCISSQAVAAAYLTGGSADGLSPGLFISPALGRLDEAGRLHLEGRPGRPARLARRRIAAPAARRPSLFRPATG